MLAYQPHVNYIRTQYISLIYCALLRQSAGLEFVKKIGAEYGKSGMEINLAERK
jgi:hypothetical protein